MRYTVEEKLNAIGMVKSGMTPCSVSRLLHLGHHSLYEWLAAYKEKASLDLKTNQEHEKIISLLKKRERLFFNVSNLIYLCTKFQRNMVLENQR